MSKINVYTVRDNKTSTFGRPFFETNHETARRALSVQVNGDPQRDLLAAFPGDFELFWLGAFDDESGLFELMPTPVSQYLLASLKRHEAVGA